MKKGKYSGKSKGFLKGLFDFFADIFGEVLFYAIPFLVGLAVLLIIGIEPGDLDPEFIALIGLVIAGLVAFIIHLLVKALKKKKAND